VWKSQASIVGLAESQWCAGCAVPSVPLPEKGFLELTPTPHRARRCFSMVRIEPRVSCELREG
jgi:hypothetical protein